MTIMTHFLTVYVCTILVAPNPAGSLLVTGSRRSRRWTGACGGGCGCGAARSATTRFNTHTDTHKYTINKRHTHRDTTRQQ